MRGFLFLCIFLCFSFPFFADETLLEELDKALERGNYHRVLILKNEILAKLDIEKDPLIRTVLKRALWVESVPFTGSGVFDPFISALQVVDDDVWIGSRSGDIARYSLSERKWFLLQEGAPSLAIRSVNAIETDRDRIWFLSYGSVQMYDLRTSRLYRADLPDSAAYRGMQSLSMLGRGVLVGTQGTGLRRILLREETVLSYPSLKNVSFLKQFDRDTLYAGTEEHGLFLINLSGEIVPAVSNNRRTSGVRTLLPLKESYLAGSYGNGLFLLEKQNSSYIYQKIYSPALWITGGTETSSGYCFSTLGNGLIYMDRSDLSQYFAGIEEGLPTLDFTSIGYSAPYFICGTQDQGLLVVHEDFFK